MTDKKFDLEIMRHSLSHVLAMAVVEMFPEAKLGIGPAIENGFYYDFDLPRTLIPEDLPLLEEKMREIIKKDLPFEKTEVDTDEAINLLGKSSQVYKLELVEDLKKDGNKQVSLYRTGDYVDLCVGPHVDSTSDLKDSGFKLDKIAGAYWKGSEKNKMLQRIYGLAFENREDLKKYEEIIKEAEKRDHRKLGKELNLFVFSDLVGPGMPLYTFRGTAVLKAIKDYSNLLRKEIGYQEVHTPNMNKAELFKVSGHYDKYKDDMFKVHSNYSNEEYYLKPMNCPQHTQIYASQSWSYRDLPVRIADFANLYRDEKPGELSGLTRLRSFSQDDGHCFCREDQIEKEFDLILGAINKAMKRYDMKYYVRLSLRDEVNKEKYIGDDETWQKSQKLLENLLDKKDIDYKKALGEAAFYGPKMDLIAEDSLGREWQISTIQIDFQMPKRFGLEYTTEDGEKLCPVMIHSALVGSPERFLGILIEHFAGAFPAWLAPVQAIILPISDKHLEYAKKVSDELKEKGIRVEIDERTESIGKKIRESEMRKVPYMLIVGDKEIEAKKVAVRKYGEGDKGQEDISKLAEEINEEPKNN